MFSSKDQPQSPSQASDLISVGSEIVGDLCFNGSLRVEGKIFGNLIADDNSGATVIICESGVIMGELSVPVVIIRGTVQGDVHACKHLELSESASVEGDVFYDMIEVACGAGVAGKLEAIYRDDTPGNPSMPKRRTQPEPNWTKFTDQSASVTHFAKKSSR